MVESLHFSITGEFITTHFRNLCLEKEFEKAVSGLKDSLIGIDMDTVISVLNGTKKFTGENEVLLEDEEDLSYREELLSSFTDLFFFEGDWYEVAAAISTIKKGDKFVAERARIYVPDFDKITFYEGILLTLKRTTKKPPFWLDTDLRYQKFNIDSVSITYGVDISQIEYGQRQSEIVREIIDYQISRGFLCKPYEKEEFLDLEFVYDEIYARNSQHIRLEEEYLTKREEELRKKVIEQAKEKGGFMKIVSNNGVEFNVPRNPFLIWASQSTTTRLNIDTSNLEWDLISPSSYKMRGDNPYHTDFCLGIEGLDMSTIYKNEELTNATYGVIISSSPNEMVTICGKGKITGRITFVTDTENISKYKDKIVVIPNAGIEYFEIAKIAKLVIANTGGPASHLALNAYEHKINLVYLKDSLNLSENLFYTFDLDSGLVTM